MNVILTNENIKRNNTYIYEKVTDVHINEEEREVSFFRKDKTDFMIHLQKGWCVAVEF